MAPRAGPVRTSLVTDPLTTEYQCPVNLPYLHSHPPTAASQANMILSAYLSKPLLQQAAMPCLAKVNAEMAASAGIDLEIPVALRVVGSLQGTIRAANVERSRSRRPLNLSSSNLPLKLSSQLFSIHLDFHGIQLESLRFLFTPRSANPPSPRTTHTLSEIPS